MVLCDWHLLQEKVSTDHAFIREICGLGVRLSMAFFQHLIDQGLIDAISIPDGAVTLIPPGLYREEVEAVARAGFRVAMVDLARDRWDGPAPEPLSWDFLGREVIRGLEFLCAGRAVLWGTSFGAMIALAAPARRPARIAGLVLSLPPDPSYRPRVWTAALRWGQRTPHADLAVRLTFLGGFLAMTSWEGVWPIGDPLDCVVEPMPLYVMRKLPLG